MTAPGTPGTAPGTPAPVHVTGGSGGIEANHEAIVHLAGLFDSASSGLGVDWFTVRAERPRLPADDFAALAGPAALDMPGYVAARQLLDLALADLHEAGSDTGTLARNLRNAALGYPWGRSVLDVALWGQVTDQLDALTTVPGLRWLQGGTIDGHGSLANGGDERIAGWDPRLVDDAIALVDPPALAELLGPDQDALGVAVPLGSGLLARAPRGLPDLIGGLAAVDRTPTPGGIDVRVLDGPGGRRVIVDITGTRTWGPGGRNVADLTTNMLSVNGHRTAYEAGVLDAMRRAGVRRTDPVMLIGHSQGGLVAVTTARDAVRTGEFHVTHVVTAGSPVGRTVGSVPRSVQVLALENPRDIVPRVDRHDNPDRTNVTTVRSPHGDGSIGGNHSLDGAYLPLAQDAQATTDRSVRDFLTGADGFFRAEHVTVHSYRVERR